MRQLNLEPSRPVFLKPWIVLASFGLLVPILRLSSFFPSVISWDESNYLIVADQWLQGHSPYTVVWDNKPPGIYALFAAALRVFGHSVLSIRILACLFVTATCYFIYLIGALIERQGWLIGIVAGILYAFSSLNNGGISSNTEVFFIAFVAMALYLVLSRGVFSQGASARDYLLVGLAGLLLGLGFEVKYVVLFDLAAIELVLALMLLRSPAGITTFLKASLALGAGFVLPFLIVSSLFLAGHRFDEFWELSVTANKARTIANPFQLSIPFGAVLEQIPGQWPFWICVPAAAAIAILGIPGERMMVLAAVGYLAWVLACTVAVFKSHLYDHYFLQLALPLCMLSSYALVRLAFLNLGQANPNTLRRRYLILALALGAFASQQALPHILLGLKHVYFRSFQGIADWEDEPAAVAHYLKPRVTADDYIYVVDDQPVLYFLVPSRLPTRYVFPPLLVRRLDLPDMTGIDPIRELGSIMDKRPVYVIKRREQQDPNYVEADRRFFAVVDRRLAQDYVLEKAFKTVDLHRLKD